MNEVKQGIFSPASLLQAQVNQRRRHVQYIGDRWNSREKPVSANIVLKIVGDNGSEYVVPQPDFQRFVNETADYNALSTEQKATRSPPVMHYLNSKPIRMNKHQRSHQIRGTLAGCIANCHVPPIGSVSPRRSRGNLLGVQFPDADEVMQRFQNFKRE